MRQYLLDTCTISDFFKGVGKTHQRVLEVSPTLVSLSCVTVMEVLYGFRLNPAAERRFAKPFQLLCDDSRVLSFDARCAETAAAIRAGLKESGQQIGAFDLLIGATAVAHGLTLVTANKREFQRIVGLFVEDWRS